MQQYHTDLEYVNKIKKKKNTFEAFSCRCRRAAVTPVMNIVIRNYCLSVIYRFVNSEIGIFKTNHVKNRVVPCTFVQINLYVRVRRFVCVFVYKVDVNQSCFVVETYVDRRGIGIPNIILPA